MTRELAIRALGLYWPITIAALLWHWRRRDSVFEPASARRLGAAVLLACGWCAPALLVLHLIATPAGWWRFAATGGLFAGMPVDLYLGWIVLWGAVPALAFRSLPVPATVTMMLLVDVVVMPLCVPVVQLGPAWLAGEGVAAALVLAPAQYLARWTIVDAHLPARTTLQAIAFSGLMLIVFPAAVLEQTGGTWRALLDRPVRLTSLLAQLLLVPGVLGLSAVQEFVTRGRGTPVPYDPPRALVTSGPYAYLANPMQVAIVLVFAVWALMLANPWILGGSAMALAYGLGLAGWDEDRDLEARFGASWLAYRRIVPRWWPRLRPFVAAQDGRERQARLYVAGSCELCASVATWLTRRDVRGLDIIPAESHPTRLLTRITYEPRDGRPHDEGIAAFARALEHIHFGWAMLAMFIRLPVVRPALQLIVDASGGGARQTGAPRCARPVR